MSDSIEFNFVSYGDEEDFQNLFRDYIEELIARLDVVRVRSACARERALLRAVVGAYHTPASIEPEWRDLREEVFRRLRAVFGWSGDEAELLKVWMELYPQPRDFPSWEELESRYSEAVESRNSDPYSRHSAFWQRCSDQGFDSFMRFRNSKPDPFSAVVALIDEAAKTLGDE